MKQLKSSREYWRSVITNWRKRYFWKGRGKFANLFRFWSNSHFSQTPDWTNFKICPAAYFILELVIETSSLHWATQNWKSFARKIVIPCVDVHFFFKFYSWHFFWNIRISFLAVSDSNGCPNLNTRHFGPGAANHDCPLGGGGGQMMVIQEM